jgi:protein-disulfide isomerase
VALLSYAVVDDLMALAVIATVYTDSVDFTALAAAAVLFAALFAVRYAPLRVRSQLVVVLSVGIWLALYESGVDPVIAGLAIGLVTSAYPPQRTELERVTELTRFFREQPTPELARSAQQGVAAAISPNERLQYRLHPWTSYGVVPLFALANIGIHLDSELLSAAVASPVTLGIVTAYVVGKPVGVLAGTWLGSRPVIRGPRRSLSWPAVAGAGAVAGIGFTVSLLIASIAFEGRRLDEARLGVLVAAVIAAVFASGVFRVIARLPASLRARQISGTREDLVDLADDVDPARDHVRGPLDAPVTLLEYGDYECPYCGQAEAVVRELLTSFGDDVRYVWRHLPLNDVHPHAQTAAEAAEAAAAQGAFWDMHDLLLDHQEELRPRDLVRYAEDLGLDVDRFTADVRERAHASRIADDVASADESGVAGTPTFFVNGRRHAGAYDLATLTAAVERARSRARARAITERPVRSGG